MKLYNLPCLLEEDSCRFQTIQLEFWQAKEILKMHMELVHGCPEQKDKCNSCDRDTYVKDDKDIIEDNVKAICAKKDEADHNVSEEFNAVNDSIPIRNYTAETEASFSADIADVTSVPDDRDEDYQHFEEGQRDLEAENNAIEEIFKPVGTILPSPSCQNCGQSDHTSERKIRRRHCPAWNQYCEACNKRGHTREVCKANQSSSKDIHLGEIAALRFCVSRVSDNLQPISKVKIPHMLYDQLQWIISKPQSPPNITVSVKSDLHLHINIELQILLR